MDVIRNNHIKQTKSVSEEQICCFLSLVVPRFYNRHIKSCRDTWYEIISELSRLQR